MHAKLLCKRVVIHTRIHTASQLDILTQDVMFFFLQKNYNPLL